MRIISVLLNQEWFWTSNAAFERHIYILCIPFKAYGNVFYSPLCYGIFSPCNHCREKLRWHTSCSHISAERGRFISEMIKWMISGKGTDWWIGVKVARNSLASIFSHLFHSRVFFPSLPTSFKGHKVKLLGSRFKTNQRRGWTNPLRATKYTETTSVSGSR